MPDLFKKLIHARRETGVAAIGVDPDLYIELHQKLQGIVAETKLNLVFTIQPVGRAAVEKGKAHGGNCMNIPAEPQSCKSRLPHSN